MPFKDSPEGQTHFYGDRCKNDPHGLEIFKSETNLMEAVKIDSVPEAEEFEAWLVGQGAPIINGESGWAYLNDYKRFKNNK